MNSAIAARLIELNHEFYNEFGDSFSATRHRIQPGVRRVMEKFRGDENILDLGCGNGWFARELGAKDHRGSYLGMDFSLTLLKDAESIPKNFSVKFVQADLTALKDSFPDIRPASFDVVTAFAVLHHIPSLEIRLNILRSVQRWLEPNGLFIHSNWQFLNSEKLKARIQSWEVVSILPSEVDAGDCLLDWRSGGKGLRYVHHYTESELSALAQESNFEIVETFHSDGNTGNLSIYQTWKCL